MPLDEDERRRRVRHEIATQLQKPLAMALETELQSEAALIAHIVHIILENKVNAALIALSKTNA